MFFKKKVEPSIKEVREKEFDEVVYPEVIHIMESKGAIFTKFLDSLNECLWDETRKLYVTFGDLTHIRMLIENIDNFIQSDHDVDTYMRLLETYSKACKDLEKFEHGALEYQTKALIDNINQSQYDFDPKEFMEKSNEEHESMVKVYNATKSCLDAYTDIVSDRLYNIIKQVRQSAISDSLKK